MHYYYTLYTINGILFEERDNIPSNFTGIVEYPNGKKQSKQWYVDGKLHRFEGPAHEGKDGLKIWFIKGNYHRLDGPAIEWAGGAKEWWIDGKQYSKEAHELFVDIMKLKGLI